MIRVAVIDDDRFFLNVVTYQLKIRNIEVMTFASIPEFDNSMLTIDWRPDVFLLDFDFGPTELNGADACRLIRHKYEKPVIILTGMNHQSLIDVRMSSYSAGAIQFLSKPHNIDELVAIITNLYGMTQLMPEAEHDEKQVQSGINLGRGCRYNPITRLVVNGSAKVQLTEKEGALLEVLMQNLNSIVDKADAYEHIYGRVMHPLNRSVDNLASRLRSKLRKTCTDMHIDNHRAKGYRLRD